MTRVHNLYNVQVNGVTIAQRTVREDARTVKRNLQYALRLTGDTARVTLTQQAVSTSETPVR